MEDKFKNKLNICLKKLNKEIDKDWIEIVEELNLDCSSDHLRKLAYGYKEYDDYIKSKSKEIEDGYTKVLVMNDIHLPFEREDILEEIKKNKDIDYLIIGGDLIDCVSCSFWSKWEHPNVNEELIYAHDFLCKVNEIINPNKTKIICIRGNHEYRYSKEIMNMQEKQLQNLLNPSLLSMLEEGFTFYEKDKTITYNPIKNFKYINNWYVKLFDNLIVSHPTDFSSIDGKMLEKTSEYFLNQDIANKDDVIIFGHTHKHMRGFVNRRQGVYVIENSCMCKPMDYANTGKLKFTPQNYGYTKLKFKKGEKINLNDIETIYLN